jgi:hypothetical protein
MMHTFNSLLRPPLLKGASWKGGINKKGRLMGKGIDAWERGVNGD